MSSFCARKIKDYSVMPLVLVACIGCGHSDRGPLRNQSSSNSVVGNWRIDPARSIIKDINGAPPGVQNELANFLISFKADGTYTQEPGKMSGTYRVEGNKVPMKLTMVAGKHVTNDDGSKNPFVLSSDGKTLTMSSGNSNFMKLTRVGS